jgi:colanic acid/amylovoran biosynthesis glycosyltransferase
LALPSERTQIAYLVSQYPTVTHTFVLREIRELRRMGFDIRVASIRASDRPFEQLTQEEQEEQRATFYIKPRGYAATSGAHLRIMLSRPFSYLRGLAYALWLGGLHASAALRNLLYFAEAVVLADWMQQEGLSHVHTHFSSTVVLLARRALPMRTSATIHGSDEFSDPAKYYLKEKIESLDLLRTISEYGRRQLIGLASPAHRSKVRVSRLGVDPEVYSPRPFRWNPSPFEILFVGRLVTAKGLYILLAALERLVREGRAVRLRIAGDGPERRGLERDAAERGLTRHVIFEGWQNSAGVAALYQQADIFALPSFAEGIPVVLMEAMAMEIACVSTSIMGIPELIRNEVDGLLVEPANEEELAAALVRLLDQPELRLRLGKSARRRVVECYDLGRNTAEFAAMLGEIHG